MVEISDIRNAIKGNKLSGQSICVHSSTRSFGGLKDGPRAIIEAFLTEGCTILVPTFSWNYLIPPAEDLRQNGWNGPRPAINNQTKIYHAGTNDIDVDMGVLPKTIVNMKERARGNHPLCSFSAIGEKAELLIKDQKPLDVFNPFEKLIGENGSILLMGVDFDTMTLLHLAEKKAGRNLFRRWTYNLEEKPIATEAGGCSEGFTKFSRYLKDIVKEIKVGNSLWKILNAEEALLLSTNVIKDNPEITRCNHKECLRCEDAIKGGPILTGAKNAID